VIGWLLDTNVIASLLSPNGAFSVRNWAETQKEDLLYMSILTLAEYDKGIENLAPDNINRHRYAAARRDLEMRFSGRVLSLDDATIRRWGAISGRVKQATGHAPPVIGTMLAAQAQENRLYLVTRNVRDVERSGAAVFNPWKDDIDLFPLRRR
jgi:predicted nucleic acid-binding protein